MICKEALPVVFEVTFLIVALRVAADRALHSLCTASVAVRSFRVFVNAFTHSIVEVTIFCVAFFVAEIVIHLFFSALLFRGLFTFSSAIFAIPAAVLIIALVITLLILHLRIIIAECK